MVGAALSTAGTGADALDNRLLAVAPKVAAALDPTRHPDDRAVVLFELRVQASEWLQAGKPPLEPDRRPFHWPLEFPEVFLSGGGLDAVVGNPPFQGGQRITGALGTDYRDWLVTTLADGRRGSADLVSYFFLRAAAVLGRPSGAGLLATNTIAQGDTREVGLDHLIATGWTISRAVKSRPWPGGDVTLEVAEVWLCRSEWLGVAVLDGSPVSSITTSLEPSGRVSGRPKRLMSIGGDCIKGSESGGTGFLISRDEAMALLEKDTRNADVLFGYLNGEDLNSEPDQSPTRSIIYFWDWPLERAATYPDCLEIVRRRVKPEREQNRDAYRRRYWWRFSRPTVELYRAIKDYERVLSIALVSKTIMPAFVQSNLIFGSKVAVFVYHDFGHFGLLTSSPHWWWTIARSSTLRADPNYSPTDCFETFPQPELLSRA